ncbi:MAG: hypothetical protein HDS83_02405 [Bacteroidales bacterium]|nr:hypothetical protein [Bacteroidales bacterium]
MANKTTESTQNVASKAAAKVAENILKKNPDIKEVHVTSDGVAFYGRNDALNHAKTLANHEVFDFKRTAKPSTPKKSTTKTAEVDKDSDNTKDTEVDELTGEAIDKPENSEE